MQTKKVAAVLVLSIFITTACTTQTTVTEFPGNNINNENLEMIENDAYKFYYPADYETYTNERQDISYSSTESNELGGNNNIGLVITEGDNNGVQPSDDDCQEIANELAEFLEGEVIESRSLDEGNMFGCYNKIEANFTGLDLVSENRAVFEKDVENATVYSVNVTYEPTASADEIQNLQDSLAKFELI